MPAKVALLVSELRQLKQIEFECGSLYGKPEIFTNGGSVSKEHENPGWAGGRLITPVETSTGCVALRFMSLKKMKKHHDRLERKRQDRNEHQPGNHSNESRAPLVANNADTQPRHKAQAWKKKRMCSMYVTAPYGPCSLGG